MKRNNKYIRFTKNDTVIVMNDGTIFTTCFSISDDKKRKIEECNDTVEMYKIFNEITTI